MGHLGTQKRQKGALMGLKTKSAKNTLLRKTKRIDR